MNEVFIEGLEPERAIEPNGPNGQVWSQIREPNILEEVEYQEPSVLTDEKTSYSQFSKRSFDIFFSLFVLVFTAIPMALVALGIKFSSHGPIFYRQNRVGRNGEIFRIWKFRTMNVCEKDHEFVQATKNDPRITRIGAFLRKTSMDELPNFINVLFGDMSVVGPRPHPIVLEERLSKVLANTATNYDLRRRVKPGITGLAQIKGYRGETKSLEDITGRISNDLEYVMDRTLVGDLGIALKTVLIPFSGKNAY